MTRRQLVLTFVAVAMAAGLSGCAGIDYSKAGPDTEGIRYYRPTTYILVAPDYEKSAAKVTLIHGPGTEGATAGPWTFPRGYTPARSAEGTIA
jgi:type IV pilus biogenesis protein CpaD/CtpE